LFIHDFVQTVLPSLPFQVPQLKVGDMVRIKSNLEKVKLLNKRIAWKSSNEEVVVYETPPPILPPNPHTP
jgi:hypothetical protein